jgi:carbonic anhydrase/acetyltransferase-like protein (isoleucine patch superfamily)
MQRTRKPDLRRGIALVQRGKRCRSGAGNGGRDRHQGRSRMTGVHHRGRTGETGQTESGDRQWLRTQPSTIRDSAGHASSGYQGDLVAIYRLGDTAPTIHESVFVAESATVIGKVSVEENASIWFGATLRGDNEPISVGAGSNVQEGAVLHTDPGYPLTIEAHVTVGHQAMLHGCTIREGTLIGIQAVVLNGAVIGRNCLVGAGAVVTGGKAFPDNSLILGSPAKVVRELTDADVEGLRRAAAVYVERRQYFKEKLVRVG